MRRTLGVCYYPEHWPEARWPEDAARMVEAGLTWVRIGEFAWARMEPRPGDLQLDWLDRAIDVLGDAGLRVVLGTPTATPPRWMLARHPDMLAVDAEGRPRGFGSRRHYCFSHEGYLGESRRITEILARRYGGHPHIAAWQTDNEYGCHDTVISYSEAARRGFQLWLAATYGDVAALNAAWGNVFWSMEYGAFDEIGLPNLTVTEPNPAHVLDFRRYSSDAVLRFNAAQVEILRAHSGAPVAHNFMGRVLEFDHFALGADLDISSWDSYPLGFLEDRADAAPAHQKAYRRQGDPDFQAFHHDLYRAAGRGRWWVMEQQPGPVNWAPYNPAPLPGMARLWAWEAFAHGAEAVLYFRWRQAPFAQEQMHSGLLRSDGAPAPALSEAEAVAGELAAAGDVEESGARVALLFDYEAAWAWEIQPQGADFSYFRLVMDVYRGLRRLGQSVDILPPDAADLSAYALVLAPGVLHWRKEMRAALKAYEGTVLIGPRAGSKTADFAIPGRLPPDLEAVDLKVLRVESLRPDAPEPVAGGGAICHWLEDIDGAGEVLERLESGAPLVMAYGGLRYLAGWPDAEAMARILGDALAAAGLEASEMPEGVRMRETKSHRYIFNHGAAAVPAGALPWLEQDLPPAGLLRLAKGDTL